MFNMKIVKITSGGQISIPAAIRKRWGTKHVSVEDEGDRLVIRPSPDDPIGAARGSMKEMLKGTSSEEMRRQMREEEIEAEERKYGR